MNLSGIFVVVKPEWLSTVIPELAALPGVEVHQVDEASGRIVVVQEAADVQAEIEGLQRIKSLPHVILAEMVYHYFAEEAEAYSNLLAGQEHAASAVPAYLND